MADFSTSVPSSGNQTAFAFLISFVMSRRDATSWVQAARAWATVWPATGVQPEAA